MRRPLAESSTGVDSCCRTKRYFASVPGLQCTSTCSSRYRAASSATAGPDGCGGIGAGTGSSPALTRARRGATCPSHPLAARRGRPRLVSAHRGPNVVLGVVISDPITDDSPGRDPAGDLVQMGRLALKRAPRSRCQCRLVLVPLPPPPHGAVHLRLPGFTQPAPASGRARGGRPRRRPLPAAPSGHPGGGPRSAVPPAARPRSSRRARWRPAGPSC